MVGRRLMLYEVPEHTAKRKPWEYIWLTIGPGSGVILTIQSDIDADTFMDLAVTAIGSRLLQDIIDTAHKSNLIRLQNICVEHAIFLAKHRHGNFVVSKLIQESVTPSFVSVLCHQFIGEIPSLAMHQRGSRVLERIMEHCDCDQIEFFFDELVQHCTQIIRHKYGNYVVQHVLEHGPRFWRRRCLVSILGSAPFNGKSDIYVRCALAATYMRSDDEFVVRTLSSVQGCVDNVIDRIGYGCLRHDIV